MKDIVKLSIALGGIACLAAAALALAFSFTEEDIKAAKKAQQAANLKLVLPEYGNDILADHQIDKQDGGVETGRREIKLGKDEIWFFIAREANTTPAKAVAGWTAAKGFGGPVEVLVGLNLDGSVRKVLVVAHTETPGIGTQVTDRKKRVTIFDLFGKEKDAPESAPSAQSVPPNKFLDQFDSFKFDGSVEVKLGPNLKPISGATISSRAVTHAVAKVAAAFEKNRAAIVTAAPPPSEN